jgi:hypothetical protein
MTLRIAQILTLVLVFAICAHAQHGTAEPGYYPFQYHLDTWTGMISSLDRTNGTITLVYEHKGKTENFTGVLKPPIDVLDRDGKLIHNKAGIKLDDRITVYYTSTGSLNTIFQIKLLDPQK